MYLSSLGLDHMVRFGKKGFLWKDWTGRSETHQMKSVCWPSVAVLEMVTQISMLEIMGYV